MNFGSYEATVFTDTPAQQGAVFQKVAAAGAKWIRWTVPFDSEEPTAGSFNPYPLAELQQAIGAGLQVDALLSNSPAWAATAAGAPGDGSPSPSAYATFAAWTAAEYSPLGINTYEIWNEENLEQPWGKAFTPQEYVALLKAAYSAIKGVDPNATILVGGLAPAPDSTDGTSYEPVTFLTQMYQYGAGGFFDALADHPYSFPDLPTDVSGPSNAWNPFSYLPTLHQIMADNGDGSKQIWLTEYGAPTAGTRAVSTAIQAEMITEAFQFAQANSWVGPLFIYDWQGDSEDSFGLYDASGAPKPSAAAFTAAAAQRLSVTLSWK